MYRSFTQWVLLLVLFLGFSALALAQGHPAGAPEIPAGTQIQVRMIDSLTSAEARAGDMFHGTLEEPLVVNGKHLFPKGADVTGTVVAAHESGRLSDPGELDLVLNTISSKGIASSIDVHPLQIKGESHKKNTGTKAGGGALLGALIGGIAGGGKGAAIGAGAGAAAGTGAAAATGKREAMVESEAVLSFVTSSTPNPPVAAASAEPSATAEAGQSSVPATAGTADSKPADSKNDDSRSEEPKASQSKTNEPAANEATEGKNADKSFDNAVLFTARDRRVIRNCLEQHAPELPAGILDKPELPSGSDRQLHVGGALTPEMESKLQSLPLMCENQLPSLPGDQERVIYSGRVLLIDASGQILDMFDLENAQ